MEHVQVFVRARPTVAFSKDNFIVNGQSITVHSPKDSTKVVNNQLEAWNFRFDDILIDSSQDQVYERCARKIVDGSLDGVSGTLLACQ